MSPKIILTYGIAWLLWTTCADAQTVRKHVLQRNEPATAASHRKKPAKRPVYQLDPTSSAARGLLVLLPGRGCISGYQLGATGGAARLCGASTRAQ
jgi:hypothetical protein